MNARFPWFLPAGLGLAALIGGARPAAAPVAPPTFRHPGVLNTQASLDQVAAQLKAGDKARQAGYQQVVAYVAKHPVPSTFPSVVYAVAGAGSPTEDQIRRDAELAYACALRWATTGEAAYARQARQVLDGYARTFQRYSTAPKPDGSPTEFRQTYLEAAWVAPTFVAAAEIIRYYRPGGQAGAGWPAADVAAFSGFLKKLQTDYVDPLPAGANWVNNWQVSCAYAQLALGVWFDDKAEYEKGFRYALAVQPQVFYANGNVKELCDRDCHHPQYTLTGLTNAAEIARLQTGDTTLYALHNQQLRVGWEKLLDALELAPGSCTDCSAHPAVWPGIETAYAYYRTPRLATLRARGAPYGVPGDDTFAGFTSLTQPGGGH
ncbi:alginate lyase family protein [Hymenobacter cheonanensis]|uniref:alginate lyase family protein n=1 Tax=Hymenobacter sp. CA2-7 TaxID=3063993 RepID=UPI002712CE1F|nr:alginate lyase family protein [Hymenobacter sp. CA2-7]MDO7887134.1 alginate lyase family protein [Hymenobacter sp. CA2-7]